MRVIKLLVFLLLSAHCYSQSTDFKKMDQYLSLMQSGERFMGSLVVFQHGKKIYSRALGFSNLQAGTTADDQTMYRVGSISKTITAALVLKAVEEGKIKLSDHIKTFFPSIEQADQITISQLLNHHSGIHNFTGGNYPTWRMHSMKRQNLIDTIAKGGSDFAPGTKASYSNSNYVLLSFILEDIYKKPYQEILASTITRPLQLKHFQFGDNMITSKNKALSYNFEAGWQAETETDLSIPLGAGAIVSSAEDLAKVLTALFQGKIISGQMLKTMQGQLDGYGYGIFERSVADKTAYSHDGAIDGFNSYFYYFPKDETVYVLLTNAENYNLNKVNELILSLVFNKPVDLPKFDSFTVNSADLQQYTGTYTNQVNPLVIDVSVKNGYLVAQPRGQRIYTMEARGKDKFYHEKTEVGLDFIPEKNQMNLTQRQQTILFTRK